MANEQLPITHKQALRAASWLKENFIEEISACLEGSPWSFELTAAIFCQETAQRVQLWFEDYPAEICLARSVFDASGDMPGTSRSAFPKNSAEFHTAYGSELTDMLISEANKMRKMPQPGDLDGWGPSHYLYKGYGIFQYDLQHIKADESFFREKKWYSITECLSRLTKVLDQKQSPELFDTIRKYNGSGQRAENYAKNVTEFMGVIKNQLK